MSLEHRGVQHEPAVSADEIRRRVVGAVHDVMNVGPPLSGHAQLDVYLALLQDRLPVYVGTRHELLASVGRASVETNLILVGLATIDFYRTILPAKISVLADSVQLTRLRQISRSHEMGQSKADQAIAGYLRTEKEAGRIAADVDPSGTARILVAACLNYVFTRMLSGDDTASAAEEYISEIVRALRLPTGA